MRHKLYKATRRAIYQGEGSPLWTIAGIIILAAILIILFGN